MIMKVASVCVTGCVFCILLRQSGRSEMALMTALAVSVYALSLAIGTVSSIVESLEIMAESIGIDGNVFKTIMKITGVAYVTQLASELCKDAGENALSGKVELCGKVIICASGLPMVKALFEVVSDIL